MYMIQENVRKTLQKSFETISFEDFSELFRHIRSTVKEYLNKTRPGIMLGLVKLGFDRGSFVGGLHYSGTNEIYLNKSALQVMKEESDEEKYKAYLYFVLLHEYIHAVGYSHEGQTRSLTKIIIVDLFGPEHSLGKLAIYGLNYYFPYTFNMRRQETSRRDLLNPEYVTLHHIERDFAYQ